MLGDGAMGTMLQKHGLEFGECPERFNLERPEVVRMIHAAYAEAGSEFVTTNTFGANRIGLARYRLDERLPEIVRNAVTSAREAVAEGVLVAASVGPTGALLEPYGDASPSDVREAFTETAGHLDAEGVDFFIVETMTDINEALLALEGVKSVSDRPVIATMSFQQTPKGMRTVMGNGAADSAALCTVARLSTPRPRNTITTASPIAAGVSNANPKASDDPVSRRSRRLMA